MRLVALSDQLLDRMAVQPDLAFTLDGQTATIDDYLELRPDREPDIRAAIARGRMAVGPWRILLDEFLVSGETIVRDRCPAGCQGCFGIAFPGPDMACPWQSTRALRARIMATS